MSVVTIVIVEVHGRSKEKWSNLAMTLIGFIFCAELCFLLPCATFGRIDQFSWYCWWSYKGHTMRKLTPWYHCSALTEQLIVVKQTWCKSKHLKTFQVSGINFFSLKCNQHCLQTWYTLFVKRHIYFEQHASYKIWWHFPVK